MAGSGFTVVLALVTAGFVFVLTIVLFLTIVAVRWSHTRRSAWRARLEARWREVLTRAVVEMPDSAPSVSRREAREVLGQWVYYQEFLTGDCRERLAHLARLAGLDLHAKRFLKARSMRLRLLAIQALGSLRDVQHRRLLWPIARSENPYESIAAAHALMRISPRETVDDFLALVPRRPDWPPARVMAILREAGPDVISVPLAEAVVEAAPAYKPLLLIYLENAEAEVALEAIQKVLPDTTDEQIIATCLHTLRNIPHPVSVAILREYIFHPNWLLQLRAVTGLGRLGNEDDIPVLVRMLRHKRFWVRYRAAQALAKLPTVDLARLRHIAASQDDGYARDMLREVLTEQVA